VPPVSQVTERGKKILVVDDEPEIRTMIKRLLMAKGHVVFEAGRGLLALQMVKQHSPDLIVLDAMLPELHGFDIARRIRGSEKYGWIPIIMVSAVYKGWEVREDVKRQYGVHEYLEKPFKTVALIDAVERALAEQSLRDTLRPPRDPDSMGAEARECLALGAASYRAGDMDGALEHLRRGVHIDPLAYRLRYQMALIYAKQRRHHEAIGELEKALELHPNQLVAMKNLAVLYENAGFKRKAVETWEDCAKLAPDAATRAVIDDHLAALRA
jgi:CheY-like chemotaxis protein